MALDGLSNKSVGIYRSKDPSKTTEKLNAKAKEKSEVIIKSLEETGLIEKVDPDAKGNSGNGYAFQEDAVIVEKSENEEETKEEIKIVEPSDDDTESFSLDYKVQFNSETQMIEMYNTATNEIVETVSPEDVIKIISKAKNISGMFVDKKI